MKYYEVQVNIKSHDIEKLEIFLLDYNVGGYDISDTITKEDLEEKSLNWATIYDDSIVIEDKENYLIKIYFEEEEEKDRFVNNIENSEFIEFIKETYIDDESYLNKWKEFYKPFTVGDSFMIVPSWTEDEVNSEKHVIKIDPGMAFGSGTHESTSLVLRSMEDLDFKNKFVYDIGCGSGILSIGAVKLGATKVIALDIDPFAIETTKENIEINNIKDKIYADENDLMLGKEDKADIIIANLIAEVHLKLIPQAAKRLDSAGEFLLSGILDEKKQMVIDELVKYDFSYMSEIKNKEWVCIRAVKK